MPRPITEQLLQNNPFRLTHNLASRFLPTLSPSHLRRYEAREPGALGVIDPGKLALFGLSRGAHAMYGMAGSLVLWAAPDAGLAGTPGSMPGEVSRIDVSRVPLAGRGLVSTRVTFVSPPVDLMGLRVGLDVHIQTDNNEPVDASVDFVHVPQGAGRALVKHVSTAPLNMASLSAIDRGHPEAAPNMRVAAVLPVVGEGNRVLAEAAANMGDLQSVRVRML